jgi:hypothetical protein
LVGWIKALQKAVLKYNIAALRIDLGETTQCGDWRWAEAEVEVSFMVGCTC